MKTPNYCLVLGSHRGRLACALLEHEQELEHEFVNRACALSSSILFEFVSIVEFPQKVLDAK